MLYWPCIERGLLLRCRSKTGIERRLCHAVLRLVQRTLGSALPGKTFSKWLAPIVSHTVILRGHEWFQKPGLEVLSLRIMHGPASTKGWDGGTQGRSTQVSDEEGKRHPICGNPSHFYVEGYAKLCMAL